LSQAVWKGFAAGACTDAETQTIAEPVEARRNAFRAPRRRQLDLSRPPTLFARAKAQRPPERQKALERRRRLATSGPMPPELACMFTMGELAVLRVVGDEWRDKGRCDRTYAELGARSRRVERYRQERHQSSGEAWPNLRRGASPAGP
jgi:hypothetical protein